MIKKVKKCILGGILLSGLMAVPVMAAPGDFPKSDQTGKITIHSFQVDDYDNLRESTGAGIDQDNLPGDAAALQNVSFSIQRLDDSEGKAVSVQTPVDESFPKRTGVTDANGQLVFSELPKGYYLITQKALAGYTTQASAFVVMLPMRSLDGSGNAVYNYDVHVYPKSTADPVITKESVSVPVVGVGDKVLWDISYPVDRGIKEETKDGIIYAADFYITDTMDSRLDYVEGSAKFKVFDAAGNQLDLAIKKDVHYREVYDKASKTVTWRYTDLGIRTMADNNAAQSVVRITTVVNESALGSVGAIWNNASIDFVNTKGEPYHQEVFAADSDKNSEGVPKVYLGSIVIDKYDKDKEEVKLADVTFKVAVSEENARKGKYIQAAGKDYQITTDENGYGRFTALSAGDYWLVETQAADGYRQLNSPVKVTIGTISANANVVISIANEKKKAEIVKGFAGTGPAGTGKIPSLVKTGDITNLFYWIFSAVLTAFIFFLVWRRRRKNSDGS